MLRSAGISDAGMQQQLAVRRKVTLSSARWTLIARLAGRRALQTVPLILGIAVVSFLLIHFAPGDPILALTGDFPLPEETVQQLREDYGLDLPVHEQLFRYLGNLARGEFGQSFGHRKPVVEVIVSHAPATLLLMISALGLAVALGLPLGVLAAQRQGTLVDNLSSGLGLAGFAVPVFWLGQLLIIAFALQLGWLPASGMESLRSPSSGLGRALDVGAHLLLPMIALSFRYLALVTRVTRTSMQESLAADFITTARAKGLLRRTVVYRHGLRNALIPVVTVVGYEMGFALSGSVLVETVFGWPGVGRLLYDAILSRDTPLILGLFVVLSVTVVAVNFVTDMVYSILDPRVSYGAKARA